MAVSTEARAPRWVFPLVVIVGALVFVPTLSGGFLGDDFVYIARFLEFPWREWPRLFTQEWSGGIWGVPLRELRPFAALSFMIESRVFGGNALPYRLTNLALHLTTTLLVARLAWRYSDGRVAATLITGLLFAIHPAHIEAVSWITGRVDLLGTSAALVFWILAEDYAVKGRAVRLVAATGALAIGMFSKEFCMFAPLLLLLRWAVLSPQTDRGAWGRRLAVLAGAVAIFALYSACRRAAFGAEGLGHNLWNDQAAWQRQASYAGWLLPVMPFTGKVEWETFSSIGRHHALWLLVVALTIGGLLATRLRNAPVAAAAFFFSGVWFFVTVFPLTAVGYVSSRHVYFPTVGLTLGLGLGISLLGRGGRVATVILALWFSAAHLMALRPWLTAGAASRDALAALDRELAAAPPGTVAVTSVPEMIGAAWLWAWSSPQSYTKIFLAHPPERVVERPVNYSRLDRWMNDRKPFETVTAAPAAVALFVDGEGHVSCRSVPASEWRARLPALGDSSAAITQDSWSAWVRSLAQP